LEAPQGNMEALKMKWLYLPLFFITILMLSSCSEEQRDAISNFGDQLSSILELKGAIDGTLEEGEAGVHISNGVALTISLINTEFNGENAEQRKQKADQLLAVVSDFIARHDNLSKVKYVTIAYVKHETKFLIVNFNETIDYYSYDLEQRDQTTPGPSQQRMAYPGPG
jgi:hypothetical protein